MQAMSASGLFEEQIPQDVCMNLDGLQTVIPDDYFSVGQGECLQDACDNLDGLQVGVPADYESLDGENCTIKLPMEYPRIQISELFPNASGVDDGQEYIELYNPNSVAVDLEGYVLALGPTFFKTYTLPSLSIAPGGYLVLTDVQTGIVLPNSSASVRLYDPSGSVASETATYDSPKDDTAWSLIEGQWQYSKVLTPGNFNSLPALEAEVLTESVGSLEDCGIGKFRNPQTNRCKSIETEDDLKACAANQERNPETNRCRTILAESALVPCKEGQERNPETNRCRSVAGATTALAPCPVGQERNPETNRCRKSTLDTGSGLASVSDVQSNGSSSGGLGDIGKGLLLILAIVFLSVAYLVYEWRIELKRITRVLWQRATLKRSAGTS